MIIKAHMAVTQMTGSPGDMSILPVSLVCMRKLGRGLAQGAMRRASALKPLHSVPLLPWAESGACSMIFGIEDTSSPRADRDRVNYCV